MNISNPTIEALLETIKAQAEQIKQLEVRIHELEQRLKKNSSNNTVTAVFPLGVRAPV